MRFIANLSRVENDKDVGESLVQWWQKTKQPSDAKKGNHQDTCFDAKSKRGQMIANSSFQMTLALIVITKQKIM